MSSLNKATDLAVLWLLSCVKIPHCECICSFPEHQMVAPNERSHLKIINHQRPSAWQKINRNTQANSWPPVHVENDIKDSKVWKPCAVWLLTAFFFLQTDDLISRLLYGIWKLFSTQFIHQLGKRLLKTFQLNHFCFVLVSVQCSSP